MLRLPCAQRLADYLTPTIPFVQAASSRLNNRACVALRSTPQCIFVCYLNRTVCFKLGGQVSFAQQLNVGFGTTVQSDHEQGVSPAV